MNAFGLSALLVGMLRGHPVPGIDEDLSRRDAAIRRLGVVGAVQLVLFVLLSWAVR